jgi:hypothetical protein
LKTHVHRWTLSSLLSLSMAAAWSAPEPTEPAANRPAPVTDQPRTAGARTSQNATGSPRPELAGSPVSSAATAAPGALAAAAPPAPAAGEPAEPSADERIRELEEQVRRLLERIEQLEKNQPAAPPAEPPAPTEPAPTEPAPAEPAPAPAPGGATLLPNISGIGNFKFSAGDTKGTEGRGKFRLSEFEFGFQDRVAPNMRVDAFLAAAQEEGWEAGLEEAYLTWTTPLGMKNLSARIGRQRTLFGKLNPQHPHTWLHVTQPPVVGAFLGPEGLNSDGILLQYLLPLGGNFLNLELGRWETASEAEDGLGFAGGEQGAYSGRLWFGREIGRDRELEIGLSHYMGRGDVEGLDRQRLAVTGLDFTYRNYPSAYQRLLLQGELFQHSTGGFSKRRRHGGYLTLAKRFNRYYEAGLRGDYTRYPYPTPGHESGGSLFLTRFLTEATALRLELRHGSRPEDGTYNEAWLQILTGFGPHSHNIQ